VKHCVDDVSSPAGDTEDISYDKLVLALGAESFKPPIKGMDLGHVFTLQTIPDLRHIQSYIATKRSQNVAVIGGGFIGLETAENLRLLGLNVTVVEYLPHIFPPVDRDMAEPLHKEMERNGIHLVLNARVTEITSSQILLNGADPINADLVIVAVGVRPRTAVVQDTGIQVGQAGVVVNNTMQTSDPDIYAVGDMVQTPHLVSGHMAKVALAGPANRQGRLAADHICGLDGSYRGNVGTAICKVFDLTVGIVGLSVEALKAIGRGNIKYLTIHPLQHAGYYPGAEPMVMKIVFEDGSGRLLGAQIVGKEGVDKRVDVLAIAIEGGLSVEDLQHVELGYSPPYGAAKDPINMAGFVGGNMLRGLVQTINAEDLVDKVQSDILGSKHLLKYQIIDVRSSKEFQQSHMIGAINIPIDDLRESLESLDKAKPVLVYCWVGYRGYLAYRILKQNGFEVVNLNGGFKAACVGGYDTLVEKS
jgi:NADPH-dependent 2,4-dienoyl-CoA reductase/sulfur reductase-like enzyme/rhodanese-related sulfurtransferase